ncbi:hypothetical protein L2E82_10170 [Cichorium intybus]|uniref:Uncharacterized protein n=1 Tax=Cichorium intybus TaxID=13427 RepID=A0ACB9G9T6_CICIN|nr:hypothetical protein L2E82_10170 [Cichorium intybus]
MADVHSSSVLYATSVDVNVYLFGFCTIEKKWACYIEKLCIRNYLGFGHNGGKERKEKEVISLRSRGQTFF